MKGNFLPQPWRFSRDGGTFTPAAQRAGRAQPVCSRIAPSVGRDEGARSVTAERRSNGSDDDERDRIGAGTEPGGSGAGEESPRESPDVPGVQDDAVHEEDRREPADGQDRKKDVLLLCWLQHAHAEGGREEGRIKVTQR